MSSQKAVVVWPESGKVAIRDVPIPEPRDGYIVIKVKAVALNPTDWQHIDGGDADVGSRSGCDYAGVVEKVPNSATKFKVGDRVAGFTHGGDRTDHQNGAFGEYVIAKDTVQIRIPDHMSFEDAATLGVGVVTCGQGLYMSLKLPLPTEPAKESFPILIAGGSTATGVLGIQLAKASGLTVLATSSPSNFDYLKSLGADAVFDYHSPDCGAEIRKFTNNKLLYAWDCFGNSEELCCSALSDSEPSKFGVIAMHDPAKVKSLNPLVDGPHFTLGYFAMGEPFFWFGGDQPAKPEQMEYVSKFIATVAEPMLAKGTLKVAKATVNKLDKGLEGVIKGLDELRNGRVSGEKLVYTL